MGFSTGRYGDLDSLRVRVAVAITKGTNIPDAGGSVEFPFLGYTVTGVHRIEGMTPEGKKYRVGFKLGYWIPFVGREQTSIIIRTNR